MTATAASAIPVPALLPLKTTMATTTAAPPSSPAPTTLSVSLPSWVSGGCGGAAAMVASACTAPIDLVKTRRQVSLEARRERVIATVRSVYAEGGVAAFYRGLSASLARQFVYSGARFAGYDALKASGFDPLSSALAAGCCGSLLGSPFDWALVRAQSAPPGKSRSLLSVLSREARTHGVLSLWRGCGPNVLRGAIVTACQLATFDRGKQWIASESPTLAANNPIGIAFMASMLSGVVTSMLAAPADAAKARAMTAPRGVSFASVVVSWTRSNGVLGWWQGLVPYYTRVAPQVTIMLVTFDWLQRCVAPTILDQVRTLQ